MNLKELVCLAARLADEKKAEHISVQDLTGLSFPYEFVILATATSKPHLDAVEEEISKKLKEKGVYKLNRDGRESNLWRVSDYGGFLVHIITQEARDHYLLDKLFSAGKPVDFIKPVKKAATKKTAAKKTAVKKTAVKKTTAKKTTAKKSVTKKTAGKTTRKPVRRTAKSTTKK